MKLQRVFSWRLKTSHRFVFENIMDLDYVCVLHRRWFEKPVGLDPATIRRGGLELHAYDFPG